MLFPAGGTVISLSVTNLFFVGASVKREDSVRHLPRSDLILAFQSLVSPVAS